MVCCLIIHIFPPRVQKIQKHSPASMTLPSLYLLEVHTTTETHNYHAGTYKVIGLLGNFHKTYSVFVKENSKLTHPVAPLKLQHTFCDWLCAQAILAPRNSYVNNISLKSQKLLPGVQYTNYTKPSGSSQTGLG